MISIIIPTLNEEHYLPKLLLSIQQQTYTDYEVIIADAHSTDKTRAIAQQFSATIVDGGMPAVGRNAGAAAAKGEYLLFLDSDVILPETFLENLITDFNDAFYDIATTPVYPLSSINIDQLIYFFWNTLASSTKSFYPYLAGWCIFTTARLHRRIGGFDEEVKMCEDHDYAVRAIKYGKYGICKSTHLWISVRRIDKEGRLNFVNKNVLNDLYRLFNGKVYKHVVEYEFGTFDEKQQVKNLSTFERGLELSLSKVARWQKDYRNFVKKIKERLRTEE